MDNLHTRKCHIHASSNMNPTKNNMGLYARIPVFGRLRTKQVQTSLHSLISAFFIRFLKSIICKLATGEISYFLESLCSWGDWFESPFVGNPEDSFCRDEVHMSGGFVATRSICPGHKNIHTWDCWDEICLQRWSYSWNVAPLLLLYQWNPSQYRYNLLTQICQVLILGDTGFIQPWLSKIQGLLKYFSTGFQELHLWKIQI